jgi:glycosyltransferase involved in cell wall biosynthesis
MITVVVPTVGRPSLPDLLAALAPQVADGFEVVVVDDRRDGDRPLAVPEWVRVVRGRAAGPAAARNDGWRAARGGWMAFLDDDVRPDPDWARSLATDLDVPHEVGGVQGRVRVPLPPDRRPTDWERSTAGLADGRWITADIAYRRAALEAVGGFDERFPRAFREDADLAARVRAAGWDLVRGGRWVTHPVRPESRWVSVRIQRGNADDALLRRMYGPGWRDKLEVPRGRRPRHVAVAAAGVAAVGLALARRRRTAVLFATAWAAGTAEFAWARIGPGPRTRDEVVTMVATSVIIPPLATVHWLRGWWRGRGAQVWPKRSR